MTFLLMMVERIGKKIIGGTMILEGKRAPVFTLLDDSGKAFSLADYKGQWMIMYFYPKDMTTGCTQQACDFRDQFASFKKKKIKVIGISKDSQESHLKFKTKYSLPFTLLSDPDGKVCNAYGVWKEKSMYGRKYMGIERTTFVIDPEGRIAKVYPKVKVKDHIAILLEDFVNSF
jgi:thioredoxin-dependent peroxiredoxin